jgi:hypothetical protein
MALWASSRLSMSSVSNLSYPPSRSHCVLSHLSCVAAQLLLAVVVVLLLQIPPRRYLSLSLFVDAALVSL